MPFISRKTKKCNYTSSDTKVLNLSWCADKRTTRRFNYDTSVVIAAPQNDREISEIDNNEIFHSSQPVAYLIPHPHRHLIKFFRVFYALFCLMLHAAPHFSLIGFASPVAAPSCSSTFHRVSERCQSQSPRWPVSYRKPLSQELWEENVTSNDCSKMLNNSVHLGAMTRNESGVEAEKVQ